MGKWREDPSFIDDFLAYMNSPEGELSEEVSATVTIELERADVDAKNRQIIWEDGKRLSISASAQRMHADYPDFPLELIETHVIGWLEMEFAPPSYTQEQLDELDRLTEAWVEDQSRKPKGVQKGPELATLEYVSSNCSIRWV